MLAVALTGCAGGSGGSSPPVPGGGSAGPTPTPGPGAAPADARLHVPAGFLVSRIASVGSARELAALPNGDLIVGTRGNSVYIIPNAESPGATGTPSVFATIGDGPANGVAYGSGFVFIAGTSAIYRVPYSNGAQSGMPQQIGAVRTGPISPTTDGDVHTTTSVAVSGSTLYIGVGSSCNACVEADPTRATIQRMGIDGTGMTTQAQRWRNAIALATDPTTGTVWAGGAGQDNLPWGHPYEYMDAVSSRPAGSDYGWPDCEENRQAYRQGANCANVVVPTIVLPAYSTIIGAAFYPSTQTGTYAFPSAWSGGIFASMHGSWHTQNGIAVEPPYVAFVPFAGGGPARVVNWNDPTTQGIDFFTGFQDADGSRLGRSTGVAVGAQGSLFIADDGSGAIYRIRPSATATSAVRR